GDLLTISDDERPLLVSVLSVWLRRAGWYAAATMLDACRHILSDTDPDVWPGVFGFLVYVRIHYITP
ncbi:hypothetical protein, partial [Enterobacter hormaechei]|uniref:hypothetical protein n=1 Tax=Enterobacter hormaechei TaxID=158836 RepID=UPI001F2C91F6